MVAGFARGIYDVCESPSVSWVMDGRPASLQQRSGLGTKAKWSAEKIVCDTGQRVLPKMNLCGRGFRIIDGTSIPKKRKHSGAVLRGDPSD